MNPGPDTPRTFRIAITELAHFCCREGSVLSGNERTPTAQQGQEGHKKLQGQRPPHYQQEVSISKALQGKHCEWTLAGRIDGLLVDSGQSAQPPHIPIVEEIKTTYCSEAELPPEQRQLHLAQVRLYAALVCEQQQLEQVEIHLTYLNLSDESVFQHRALFSADSLQAFLSRCCQQYTEWLDQHCLYLQQRDQSLNQLPFPFAAYRAGQRTLSVTVYRDIREQKQGLYHAPTGLGKTMATLFPALRQLGQGVVRQIWYLTAKNSGHNSVRQALQQLSPGLNPRVIYLQAKDKTCTTCPLHSQQNCTAQSGYYDRLPAARWEFQTRPCADTEDLNTLAQRHKLCPHQLARDLLPWVDLVVADYNYVFDPYTRLSDALNKSRQLCLLVDEAHNLPDRARTMFSAALQVKKLGSLASQITDKPLKSRLKSLARQCRELCQQEQASAMDSGLRHTLLVLSEQLNEWFLQQNWLLFPQELFESVMELWRFAQRAQTIHPEDAILLDPHAEKIQIYCTDPAPELEKIAAGFHSSHYFSGSLLPLHYFQRCITTNPQCTQLILDSPFPPAHQSTVIIPLNTRYPSRPQSLPLIGAVLHTLWQCRPGRYLLAAPSFEYLGDAMDTLRQHPQIPLLMQPNSPSPEERAQFLAMLQQDRFLAGVITGGLFAEGIDLKHNTLDGVIIIGTCLPPPSPERERIKHRFDAANRQGFDFAYRYPAINRVIQTAGRLIRDEQDRGIVLLLDDRFNELRYRTLMPTHWQPRLVKNPCQLEAVLDAFYRN